MYLCRYTNLHISTIKTPTQPPQRKQTESGLRRTQHVTATCTLGLPEPVWPQQSRGIALSEIWWHLSLKQQTSHYKQFLWLVDATSAVTVHQACQGRGKISSCHKHPQLKRSHVEINAGPQSSGNSPKLQSLWQLCSIISYYI